MAIKSFIEQISDFERWDEIFNIDEIKLIKDFYIENVEAHRDKVVFRLLGEDGLIPYYVWMVFELAEDGVVDSITIYEPESDGALVNQPDELHEYPFLKLEDRTFDIKRP